VRSILLEDENLLKKWTINAEDDMERELAKLGIYPIERGDKGNSKLGQGMYNTVLDVVYNGKRAAARYSDKFDELRKFLLFTSYKDKLPKQYAKHFPKVYKQFELFVGRKRMYGVVVELLDELPPGLLHDLDNQGVEVVRKSRVSALKDPELIVDLAVESSPKDVEEQKTFVDLFNEKIAPALGALIGKPIDDYEDLLYKVVMSSFSKSRRKFYDKLLSAVKLTTIPMSGSEYQSGSSAVAKRHPSKSVREFQEFLLALKEAGLPWDDLHTGNFMMRRGTEDLVVVDPGLFGGDEPDF
jgi:hypothetical protein